MTKNTNKKPMDREIWSRIERGMKLGGWKVAGRIHRDIPKNLRDNIVKDTESRYPQIAYEHKWYTDHNRYLVLFVKRSTKEDLVEMESEYNSNIIDRLKRQNEKGLEKYGILLENNKELGINERIEHLAEELTDGLQYIEHIKKLIDSHNEELVSVISSIMMLSSKETINKSELVGIAKHLNGMLRELNGKQSIEVK